ncbi:hypothetical protein PENSUB_10586 [Penicillium subrubescens]|uniref:Uncharacterized protein n=1 Tax=Penicillium subrubescens TaxID=1316194 RepID=A0A1Q5T855_9EURO|nr:hypothetical protein PENSUB_10586 [Penicillium subrubescens]
MAPIRVPRVDYGVGCFQEAVRSGTIIVPRITSICTRLSVTAITTRLMIEGYELICVGVPMLFYTPATTTAIDVILLHMSAVLGYLA